MKFLQDEQADWALVRSISLGEELERLFDLPIESVRQGVPANAIISLIFQVLILSGSYFRTKEPIRMHGFRNPDVIVGQSQTASLRDELVESRTIPTRDFLVHTPEDIAFFIDDVYREFRILSNSIEKYNGATAWWNDNFNIFREEISKLLMKNDLTGKTNQRQQSTTELVGSDQTLAKTGNVLVPRGLASNANTQAIVNKIVNYQVRRHLQRNSGKKKKTKRFS